MSQPRISQANFWENYKTNILRVIRSVLIILRSQPNLPYVEDHAKKNNLNRELYKCFRKAAYQEKCFDLLPVREGKNPPFEGDLEPTERESKVPDFYWHRIDHTAEEDFCERRFVLECKRLGYLSSPNWILNENYINNGIRRFITSPHEYGKGDDTGGMIGYIQSMNFDQILEEVNIAASTNSEPITGLLLSSNGWVEKGVSELGHELVRHFPITPYFLYHFWVDLRDL